MALKNNLHYYLYIIIIIIIIIILYLLIFHNNEIRITNKHNYESFWEINQTLCDKHVADMKKYAVRVFSNKYNRFVQPCFAIGELKSNFEAGTPE